MAVLLLIDIVLGFWSAINSIKVIAAVVISVLVSVLVIPMIVLICKKKLNKTVSLKPIRGVLFPI